MADVEMMDAPPKAKTGKAVDTGADGKKRFEIKKVGITLADYESEELTRAL